MENSPLLINPLALKAGLEPNYTQEFGEGVVLLVVALIFHSTTFHI